MVPADSTGDSPTPAYSGARRRTNGPAYGTLTHCGAPSHALPRGPYGRLVPGPTTPGAPRRAGFGLFRYRSPLLTESLPALRQVNCFLLLRVLRCFSSPGSPPDLAEGVPRSPGAGCPIRKPADQIACADPRGLSQLGASFIASGSLGIPRAPLFTWNRPPARAGGPRRRPEGRLGGIAVSAQHVNERAPGKTRHIAGTEPVNQGTEKEVREGEGALPERRCSSRTFRYGYLVTT